MNSIICMFVIENIYAIEQLGCMQSIVAQLSVNVCAAEWSNDKHARKVMRLTAHRYRTTEHVLSAA